MARGPRPREAVLDHRVCRPSVAHLLFAPFARSGPQVLARGARRRTARRDEGSLRRPFADPRQRLPARVWRHGVLLHRRPGSGVRRAVAETKNKRGRHGGGLHQEPHAVHLRRGRGCTGVPHRGPAAALPPAGHLCRPARQPGRGCHDPEDGVHPNRQPRRGGRLFERPRGQHRGGVRRCGQARAGQVRSGACGAGAPLGAGGVCLRLCPGLRLAYG